MFGILGEAFEVFLALIVVIFFLKSSYLRKLIFKLIFSYVIAFVGFFVFCVFLLAPFASDAPLAPCLIVAGLMVLLFILWILRGVERANHAWSQHLDKLYGPPPPKIHHPLTSEDCDALLKWVDSKNATNAKACELLENPKPRRRRKRIKSARKRSQIHLLR